MTSQSAEAQRLYGKDVVRPAARRGELTVEDVADAFRQHINGRRGWTEIERTERLAFVDQICADKVPDDVKVGTLVLRSYQIGAYASLNSVFKQLPRRRYRAPQPGTPPSPVG